MRGLGYLDVAQPPAFKNGSIDTLSDGRKILERQNAIVLNPPRRAIRKRCDGYCREHGDRRRAADGDRSGAGERTPATDNRQPSVWSPDVSIGVAGPATRRARDTSIPVR
jgi:hypothetical protein